MVAFSFEGHCFKKIYIYTDFVLIETTWSNLAQSGNEKSSASTF